MSRPTELGTLAGMTGLIGVLPLILTGWLALWLDSLSALALTIIHVVFMILGAVVFARWFGN